VAALALLPAPDPSAFHANGTTPGFFTSGDVRSQIHEGETVFVITERPGTELEWLASSGFWYQVPQGYVGPVPAVYEGQPLFRGLAGVQLNPYVPRPEDFAAWLTERGVSATLLDDDVAWKFAYLLHTVGMKEVHRGDGVSVWRPRPDGYHADDPADVVVNGDLDHVGGDLRAFSFPSLTGGDRVEGPIDRPTLFSFVGPDCSTCEQHLEALGGFAREHPDVRVIAVSSWDPELRNAELIRSMALDYEVAQDPLGRMATAADADTLPDVSPPTPFSILIGDDGTVEAVYRGVWSAGTAPAPIASYTGP
jgi:thiol-disulfide isomerase/thioredoxin